MYRHSGLVVERPFCDREVAGSIPGRVIPKTLKMVLSIKKVELGIGTGQLSVSIMWLSGISCQSVLAVIFQWGSTLKVSIELPATSRHRRDMTERLLKATLSPNQSNQMWLVESPCRGIGSWLLCFLAYLSTKCSWWAIVSSQCPSSVRRPSCVVRRAASTIALKAYFFYTPRPIDSTLGKKHWGDL